MSKNQSQNGQKEELLGQVHVVSMQQTDDGITETVTKVGVNAEPAFRAAEESKKIAGMTVKIIAERDNTVKTNESGTQFASKKVLQIQNQDGQSDGTTVGSTSYPTTPAASAGPQELTGLQVLKNKEDEDNRTAMDNVKSLWEKISTNSTIAGIGLGIGVVAAAIAIAALFIH